MKLSRDFWLFFVAYVVMSLLPPFYFAFDHAISLYKMIFPPHAEGWFYIFIPFATLASSKICVLSIAFFAAYVCVFGRAKGQGFFHFATRAIAEILSVVSISYLLVIPLSYGIFYGLGAYDVETRGYDLIRLLTILRGPLFFYCAFRLTSEIRFLPLLAQFRGNKRFGFGMIAAGWFVGLFLGGFSSFDYDGTSALFKMFPAKFPLYSIIRSWGYESYEPILYISLIVLPPLVFWLCILPELPKLKQKAIDANSVKEG